jgi:hypothetical protein
MRPLAIALLFATACASAPPPPPAQAASKPQPETVESRAIPIPARGVSCTQAILVDATTEHDGIAKENFYIADNYPGAKKLGQALITCNGKPADQIDIETANGVKRSLYFDISKFFGKP